MSVGHEFDMAAAEQKIHRTSQDRMVHHDACPAVAESLSDDKDGSAVYDCDEGRTECECREPQNNDLHVCMACGLWITYGSRA